MDHGDLVVVSNRGPVSFAQGPDGRLTPRRGAGGLVSVLGPAVAGTGALWVSAAITAADRTAARAGSVEAEGFSLRQLVIDEDAYRRFYDVIANGTLWFTYHGLYDLPRAPVVDQAWHEAWDAYVAVNEAFAGAVAEAAPAGATVLVQDLHLSLVGPRLAAMRPDLATAHFAHTPFCWPDGLAVLPKGHARQLLDGLAGHGAVGFHSRRWADAFLACCEAGIGRSPSVFVSPAAADAHDIGAVAASPRCSTAGADLDEVVGDRAVLVRVDRMELSKNVVRGFLAFDELLRRRPRWRGRVVFVACCYPTRENLPEYAAYRDAAIEAVAAINDTWGTSEWTPVVLMTDDDFPRSVAALQRADAVLVNPIRDGLNIVAKEFALINERQGVMCLSRQAGVFDEMGDASVPVDPYDVAGTADALDTALSMPPADRAARFATLREAASRRTPADWLADQLDAARRPPG